MTDVYVPPAWYGTAVYGASFYGWPPNVTPGSGGPVTMDVELWRATIDNELVELLTERDPVDGSISMNVDRAVKLSGSFTITRPERMTPFVDYLAPFVSLSFGDGRPPLRKQYGLYRVEVPPSVLSIDDARATFTGDDLTVLLAKKAYVEPDEVPSGTLFRDELIETLTEVGVSRHALPATTRVTGYDRTYPPGTTRLQKINALTDRMGWYQVFSDLEGRISGLGLGSRRAIEPFYTIRDEDLLKDIEVQPSNLGPANIVTVVRDNPGEPILIGVARNDDPASPTSTTRLGEIYADPVYVTEAEDQDDVDSMAARLLEERRSYYRTAKVSIFPFVDVGIHQTVRLALTGRWASLNGLWWVRTWDVGLSPSTLALTMELNQLTDDVTGAVV